MHVELGVQRFLRICAEARAVTFDVIGSVAVLVDACFGKVLLA